MAANIKAIEPVGITLELGTLSPCYVSVGGIGLNNGDPIDNTCLSNVKYITKQPNALNEVPDIPFTAYWLPADDHAALVAEIGLNQSLSYVVPEVGSFIVWGYLQSFEVGESGKGEAMQGSGAIVVTNLNATGVETGPAFTAAV